MDDIPSLSARPYGMRRSYLRNNHGQRYLHWVAEPLKYDLGPDVLEE